MSIADWYGASNLPDWFRDGEHALGGACPFGFLEEGGYCEPLSGRGGMLDYEPVEPPEKT
jgi:hypothetical protein